MDCWVNAGEWHRPEGTIFVFFSRRRRRRCDGQGLSERKARLGMSQVSGVRDSPRAAARGKTSASEYPSGAA